MKGIVIWSLVIIVFSTLVYFGIEHSKLENAKTLYTGVVYDRVYESGSSGYKSITYPHYIIYLKESVTKKVIKVYVNVPTYYECEKGKKISFLISNRNMYDLGNTTDPTKNLYNK